MPLIPEKLDLVELRPHQVTTMKAPPPSPPLLHHLVTEIGFRHFGCGNPIQIIFKCCMRIYLEYWLWLFQNEAYGELYVDDGHSFDYKNGKYIKAKFQMTGTNLIAWYLFIYLFIY